MAGFVVGIAVALTILITGYVREVYLVMTVAAHFELKFDHKLIVFCRPVSGGSLNPARSLGPAVVSWRFNYIWLYIVGPTVGAVVGAYLARMLRIQRRHCSPANTNLHAR